MRLLFTTESSRSITLRNFYLFSYELISQMIDTTTFSPPEIFVGIINCKM